MPLTDSDTALPPNYLAQPTTQQAAKCSAAYKRTEQNMGKTALPASTTANTACRAYLECTCLAVWTMQRLTLQGKCASRMPHDRLLLYYSTPQWLQRVFRI